MADATETPSGQEPTDNNTPNPESGSDRSIESFSDEAKDYIRRLRDENARRRTELKDLNTRLKDFEDRNKTDDQKREDERKDLERRATSAESELMRFRVAAKKGVPLHLADRLRGSTEEELEADAEKLAQDFGFADGGSNNSGGSGFGGGVRRPVNKPKSMNDLIRQKATGHI